MYDCKKLFRVHPGYIAARYFVAWIQSKVYLIVIQDFLFFTSANHDKLF